MRAERGTWALGVAAIGLTAAVAATELARVWSLRSAQDPEPDLLGSADAAVRDTVAVAVAAYETGTTRENAALNLLGSFSITFGCTRMATYLIRRRGRLGPVHDVLVGGRHVHHFVPGIVLVFLAGGASVLSRNEALDPLLALPFGVGAALTLDESALLLKLDDVYWTEEGIVSVQITLAVLALASAAVLATKALRRGERRVLGDAMSDPEETR